MFGQTKVASAIICLLSTFAISSVAGVVDESNGCCSDDHKVCLTGWRFDTQEECLMKGGRIWFPEGDMSDTQCLTSNKECSVNADCCGNLVCDGTSGNLFDRKCRKAGIVCRNMPNAEVCESRSACQWTEVDGTSKCTSISGLEVYDAANPIPDTVEKTECCSTNRRSCPTWARATHPRNKEDCAAANKNWVWLPNGGQDADTCQTNGSCSVHADCCATDVCDGTANNFKKKNCHHPVDLCKTYKEEVFCNSRSSCEWTLEGENGLDGTCVPNFDYTEFVEADMPPDIPDDPACCSKDSRSCPVTGTPKSQEQCQAADPKWTWLPEGGWSSSECKTSGSCSSHSDCCSTLVCDGTADNFTWKRCRHPIDLCSSYEEEVFCNTRSSCEWKDNVCVPNFDHSVFIPENMPEDIPDDPACCSIDHKGCPTTGTPKSYEQCKEADDKWVWLPEGNTDPKCKTGSWCKTNDDCCGTKVCNRLMTKFKDRKCYHPVDLCSSYDESSFCKTRSGCDWIDEECVPTWDYSKAGPDVRPPEQVEDDGCCSYNHMSCEDKSWTPKTYETCAANSTMVWIPGGNKSDPNRWCTRRGDRKDCDEHWDCCGNLVCSPLEVNVMKFQCQHPLDICPRKTTAGTCDMHIGCAWDDDKNSCGPSFDVTIVERAPLQALPPPPIIRSANRGNPDYLGLCRGFIGSAHGDPHVTSFDRNKYDCQGTGAFQLINAPGQLELQGMFGKLAPSNRASFLVGIAIEYPEIPGAPRVQISEMEEAVSDATTYPLGNNCDAHIYIDGVLTPASRGTTMQGEGYTFIFNDNGSIDMQFYKGADHKNGKPGNATTAIRLQGNGRPNNGGRCVMNVKACLPEFEEELRANTVGVLGTPNGIRTDEWTTPTGEVLPMNGNNRRADSYDSCTRHHCVLREEDSLFVYESTSFDDRYSCDAEFPGEIDVEEEATPEMIENCGGLENEDCLIDAILLGPEAGIQNREVEADISEIATTPGQTEKSIFNIPETPLPEDILDIPEAPIPEDILDIPEAPQTLCPEDAEPGKNDCPQDVVLLSSKGTAFAPGINNPIKITSQDSEFVTFDIINPYPSDIQAMYYQFPFSTSGESQCNAEAPLASCDPISVTAHCVFGRDADHQLTSPFALVDIWFVDPSLTGVTGHDEIPKCCQPDESTVNVPTIVYTYKVSCESRCPTEGDVSRISAQVGHISGRKLRMRNDDE